MTALTAVVSVNVKGHTPINYAVHVEQQDSLNSMISDALIAARAEHYEQQVQRIKFNAELREGMIRDASGR